jgi:N6-adenosine-specific RNA methylase IME4
MRKTNDDERLPALRPVAHDCGRLGVRARPPALEVSRQFTRQSRSQRHAPLWVPLARRYRVVASQERPIRNALAFLWVPGPFLAIGAHIAILRAWGFEPTAMGFTWLKLKPNAPGPFIYSHDIFTGTGLTTSKKCEFVVIGKRGAPKRVAADVREAIVAAVRQPSRKPHEIYRRIERYCTGPRLDFFGRQCREGWAVWGNEATVFDVPAISIPPVLGVAS